MEGFMECFMEGFMGGFPSGGRVAYRPANKTVLEENAMTSRANVRIGGASGYWGDTADAPRQLVEGGDLDFLVFDYLAEVTMAILGKQKSRNPDAGFATDFVSGVMKPLIGTIAAKGIRVVANAGGVNLDACARALRQVANDAGVTLRIATVEGDDLLGQADRLRAQGVREMFTEAPLPDRLMSANAYFGAFPIAAALDAGADIVLTGRCVDSAVTLGPLIHTFGWTADDLDRLAQGSLCGHLLECGAQATGGNFTDWRDVEAGWENVGFPIAEVSADGAFIITKPPRTGGAVTPLTVGEQLLYEIGDPANYVLPDVVCDFTDVTLTSDGPDRVRVVGAHGKPPTPTFKVSATYASGFRAIGATVFAGFEAPEKARRTGEAIVARCERMFREKALPRFRATAIDVIGNDTLYGRRDGKAHPALRECVLRVAVQHDTLDGADLFAREYVGTGLSMATGRCGLEGGRPTVSPVVKLFSFLLDKADAPATVKFDREQVSFVAPVCRVHERARPERAGDPRLPDPVASAREIDVPLIDVPLIAVAVARSGDKGADANIGVMARDAKFLPAIRASLTEDAVKKHFAHYADGAVERYELPGMNALNFVLRDSLGGGGTSSVRLDVQAKTFAQLLLSIPVRIPQALESATRRV